MKQIAHIRFLFVAIFALGAVQSAWADEIVDLGGETYSGTASVWTPYEGKIVTNGTFNLTGSDNWTAGTYTLGDGAIVNCSGEFNPSGNYNLNIVGGEFNMTGGTGNTDADPAFALPYRNGQSTLLLDGGKLTSNSARAKENLRAVNIGFIWNNKDSSKNVDFSAKAVLINNSTLSCSSGALRISGAKGTERKLKTSKVDFAVTNSTINLNNAISIGTDVLTSNWVSDSENSYVRVVFGPGSDITCDNIYAYKSLVPEVLFDGATVHKSGSDGNFIGQNTGLSGDIYTIGAGGLTIDIPSDQSFTAGSNMSVLKGAGGITKIGDGSITVNSIVSSSTAKAMTFTGPLVVSNGTWSSSLSYAATSFAVDGANSTLALSGALTNATVSLAATDGGTLTLAGATTPNDAAPNLMLAGGGTTDYFTRDSAVSTYTFDSLTLGEGAVLDLDGDATAIDAINATTTTITATSANPATININFIAAPAAGATFTFFETDNADKFTVNPKLGSLTIPHEVSVKNGMLTLTITADDYTWNGTGTNWGDTGAWTKNDASVDWSDGNNAIFGTANATATLAANAAASEVRFTAGATVSGSATLTASKVMVSDGVAATISAPTAGSLEKTGPGTLTLGASRTDQTTLSEGTLAMSGATVDGTKLTLGTDAAKPVVFDYGGQTFSANLSLALGGYDVSLTNGNFTSTDKLVVADGTLRVKKNSSVSANGYVVVGGTSDTATSTDINALLEIDGGAVTNSASSKHCIIGDYGAEGSVSRMVVKNGGSYYSRQDIVVGNRSTGYLTVDNSTVEAYGYLYFCYDAECLAGENGYVSLTNNGVLAVQKVTYRNGAGNGYFNFDGGTLKATANNQTLLEKKDRLFVNVNAAGGTIDNNGKTITISADLLGAGDMTLVGSGNTTIGDVQTGTGALNVNAGTVAVDGGVTVARPTTVASGATFTVNATSQATVNTLTLEAGSTLNIASYVGTAAALSATTLTLPDSDTVPLTLNGGAFPAGTYKILDKLGITVAEVQDKLVPSTGGETYSYSVSDDTLVLTVGTPVHGRWRSAAGNGNFSDPGNWEDGQVPVAGDTLDFSGVTSSITINCGDLSETAFARVTLPTAKVQVTINGTLRLASMTVVDDSRNFSVASGSKLIVNGDVTLSSDSAGTRYIVYENKGMVEIGGKVLTSGKAKGYPCYKCSDSATIAVEGIVSGSSEETFKLNAFTSSTQTSKWIIGGDGLSNESGKKEFWLDYNISAGAELKAAEDFAIDSKIGARTKLTLDTNDGKTITINGEIYREHGEDNTLTVKGAGKVVCNYEQTESKKFDGNVVVTNTATLAINAGKWVTTGTIIVNTNATLQVAESGTVALGGGLTLKDGAALGFNYTTRDAPVLDLTDKAVTFDEGATTNVVVKITADAGKRAKSGANELTSGGKFADAKVSLADSSPDWALSVSVNGDGNIVLDVKPLPTIIIIR